MEVFTIGENDANQRLDKFLRKLFPKATRGLIYKFNRKGKIKVATDEKAVFKKEDNEYKLEKGNRVKIFLSPEDIKLLTQNELENTQKTKENGVKLSKNDIVYEDASLLVINKNAGLNVHPGDHKTKELSLIEMVHDYLGDKLNSLTFRPSLVHRIDRDTSGIVLIAKKKDILSKLVSDFKTHNNITKIYYVLALGKMPFKRGKIDKKLERIENAKNTDKVTVSEDGKEAITYYEVLSEKKIKTKNGEEIISELKVEIKTGRMHQIRVHLADNGTPIVGDNTYGNKPLNHYIEKEYGLGRQALHAWQLDFFHYDRNKKVHLEARLKDDIGDFIKKLK